MNKPPESDLIMAIFNLLADYRTYILMALMGAWGAVVKHLEAVKKGLPLVWLEVHISLFTGAFIGIVVGLGLKSLNVNDYVLYASIGIASNMGTVSLKLMANAMSSIFVNKSLDDSSIDDNQQKPPTREKQNAKRRK